MSIKKKDQSHNLDAKLSFKRVAHLYFICYEEKQYTLTKFFDFSVTEPVLKLANVFSNLRSTAPPKFQHFSSGRKFQVSNINLIQVINFYFSIDQRETIALLLGLAHFREMILGYLDLKIRIGHLALTFLFTI